MSGQSKSLISIGIFMLENWVQHRFQMSPFSSVHTKTKRFQKSPLSKAFLKVSVFGGNDSAYLPWTCGRKAKTDKEVCVFIGKRIREDGTLELTRLNFKVICTWWQLATNTWLSKTCTISASEKPSTVTFTTSCLRCLLGSGITTDVTKTSMRLTRSGWRGGEALFIWL